MNVFETHAQIVDDYANYIRSFINIADNEIARKVKDSLSDGSLWLYVVSESGSFEPS